MLVYRYRAAKSFNIETLLNCQVNGSLFKTFSDGSELNYDISDEVLKKYCIDDKQKVLDILINNIKDKYYLACFTENNPFHTKNMWKEYADNGNGFCLVYDFDEIRWRIQEQRLGQTSFEKVKYDIGPYCIDKLIEHICSKDGVRSELENNDIDAAVSKGTPVIGKVIMAMFLNKKISNSKEKEIRMIMQGKSTNNPPRNQNMLCIKPKSIIVSKSVNIFDRKKILDFANKNGIECLLIDNPCSN